MNNPNILIVDDNKDLAECLEILLKEKNYEVAVVFNGEDAVDRATEQHFDIAIIDIKLPGINGVEVFRSIRKISPETHAIMMTGYRVDQLIQEAIDGGAVCVLHKPFHMETLFEKLLTIQQKGIILVADDDPEFSASAAQLLSAEGYKVLIARTGQEAVDQAISGQIDVLVLDLKLPVMHGLDVYLNLAEQGHIIPTIIVTGYAAQEMEKIDALRSMSVTGCLFKPFNPEELLRGIDDIVSSKSATINSKAASN